MKKISTAIVLVLSVLVYFMQEEHTDELVIENVEALSAGETNTNVRKALYIHDNYGEETHLEAEYDDKGNIKGWKVEVDRVVHTVECVGEGIVTCKARKDFHCVDNPEFCPNNQ